MLRQSESLLPCLALNNSESMRGIMMSCAVSKWRILEFHSEGKHNSEKSLMIELMKGRGLMD